MSYKRSDYYLSCCLLIGLVLCGFGFKHNYDQIIKYPYKDIILASGIVEKKFDVSDSYYIQIDSVQKEVTKKTYDSIVVGKKYEISKIVSNTGKYIFFNFILGFVFVFSTIFFLVYIFSIFFEE